jgi:hypothetical protein
MSEVAAVKPLPQVALKPLQVAVVGKVVRVRRYEKFFYTTVICPAVDVYSRPSVVEIRSKARFADADEETRCTATLGGYEGKPYAVTDRETGERRSLVPVHLFLDAVEG